MIKDGGNYFREAALCEVTYEIWCDLAEVLAHMPRHMQEETFKHEFARLADFSRRMHDALKAKKGENE